MANPDHRIARQIRAARAYAGMSREQVGQALGVHEQTISRWERGAWKEKPPRLPMLEKIAQVTGIPDLWIAAGFLSEAEELSPLEAQARVLELLAQLTSEPGDTRPGASRVPDGPAR